ncbi:MAG: hypothetical protein QM817_08780 [Archangium sp.]
MLNRASLVILGAVILSGCGSNLCDRSKTAQKNYVGDCSDAVAPPLLGGMCSANLSKCSEADQKAIDTALTCIEKLPACLLIAKDAWALQRDTCNNSLTTLSQPCKDAFFMGVAPGFDAGIPDAGQKPISDGGNGLTLLGTANEDTVALAWVARREANVERWLLIETDALGDNYSERDVAMPGSINFTIPDAGMSGRHYFLAGLNANGDVLLGTPPVVMVPDAGPADAGICMGPNDCAMNRVCDLMQCKVQNCIPGGMNTCPNSYACNLQGECARTTADGGVFNPGGGTRDAGTQPLPMISNEILLTPRPPMAGATVSVGNVAGRRPDIAAYDTARVTLALEQEGQLIAHPSIERGSDFTDEIDTSFGLDTTGARVHLTWDAESRSLFACYVVGTGIRVQKAGEGGRKWGTITNTFMPPLLDDGGIDELYRDCDIAPWKNGGALLVTAEQEVLMVRELDENLNVVMRGPAFLSQFPPLDGGSGGITNPAHPAIATLPSMNLTHITFTGTRVTAAGSDTEPYGVARNGATASFGMPTRMTSAVQPSALPEDYTAVAIHPATGRAVGAFTSVVQQGTVQYSTVYVALYFESAMFTGWSSGSHLNVLVADTNTTVLFPQKGLNDTWFAYSPALAPLQRSNLFALTFVTGPRDTMGIGQYKQYLVPFDLDRVADIQTSAKGWFVRPVTKISDVRVLDPRGPLGSPQPTVSALAGDSQISVYGVFVQGAGLAGDVEAPAQYFHWP